MATKFEPGAVDGILRHWMHWLVFSKLSRNKLPAGQQQQQQQQQRRPRTASTTADLIGKLYESVVGQQHTALARGARVVDVADVARSQSQPPPDPSCTRWFHEVWRVAAATLSHTHERTC